MSHIVTYLFTICLFQKHTITTIPITQCECSQKGGKKMTYYVYGLDNKVHAPTYPDTCCWGCEIMWRNTLSSFYLSQNDSVHTTAKMIPSTCQWVFFCYLNVMILVYVFVVSNHIYIRILIFIINNLEGNLICLIFWSTRSKVMWKVIWAFVIIWRSSSVHLYSHSSFYIF